jgi:hypothetical protein
MEDQLHINRQMIRPILHEDLGKKDDLSEVCSTQCYGKAKEAKSHTCESHHPSTLFI